MIFGDGRAARGRMTTVTWYNRACSFAVHRSLLGLLLLNIVCEVGEGLARNSESDNIHHHSSGYLSPTRPFSVPVAFASYVQPWWGNLNSLGDERALICRPRRSSRYSRYHRSECKTKLARSRFVSISTFLLHSESVMSAQRMGFSIRSYMWTFSLVMTPTKQV